MIPAVVEKATFGIAVLVLFAQQRIADTLPVFGIIDLLWGLLFLAAFRRARPGRIAGRARPAAGPGRPFFFPGVPVAGDSPAGELWVLSEVPRKAGDLGRGTGIGFPGPLSQAQVVFLLSEE